MTDEQYTIDCNRCGELETEPSLKLALRTALGHEHFDWFIFDSDDNAVVDSAVDRFAGNEDDSE